MDSSIEQPAERIRGSAWDPIRKAWDIVPVPSFRIFPEFPQEIRLQIWRSTFEPKKVVIRVESDGGISTSCFSDNPTALYICSESRQEALKCYRLIFEKSPFPTFFNPIIDIPHVRHGSQSRRRVAPDSVSPFFNFSKAFLTCLQESFDANFLSNLRHLAIDRDLWVLRMGSAPKMLSLFGKLEEVIIVIDNFFLRDEYEWVETDEDEENEHYFSEYVEITRHGNYGYHAGEERVLYILRREKQLGSSREASYFTDPQASSIYAAFVEEDVLARLDEGVELGNFLKHPKVKVVTEAFQWERHERH